MSMGMIMFIGGIAGAIVCFVLCMLLLATAGRKRRRLLEEIQRGL